jgi:hypothetical protein
LPPVQLVSLILAVNLPMTTVANNWNNIRLSAYTLKWTWRQKIIYLLTLLPKGVQIKQLKLLYLPTHLELRISQQIFENLCIYIYLKIVNGPNGVLWGLGKTGSWKNLKSKISWLCPFKRSIFIKRYFSNTSRQKLRFRLAI